MKNKFIYLIIILLLVQFKIQNSFANGFSIPEISFSSTKNKNLDNYTLLDTDEIIKNERKHRHNSNTSISFSHSSGAAFYLSGFIGAPGVIYSPRLNVVELADEVTFSIGTHLGLGINYDSYYGGAFVLDIPVMAEINIGHAANQDTRSNLGGFAGIGYGLNIIASGDYYDSSSSIGSGIVLNAGMRYLFEIKAIPPLNGKSLSLRVSYMVNLHEDKENVFSLGLSYNLGKF